MQLPNPVPQTPARAAAAAVGRAAEKLYQLGVQPVSIQTDAATSAEIVEILPDPALIVVLQGPKEGVGVMALCLESVTALIEIQALGRVTARSVDRRKPTRSDALICVEFINRVLGELGDEMIDCAGYEGIGNYHYATYLDDVRPLALMLEDKPYRSLDMGLRLGGAETRQARIFVAIPQLAPEDRKVLPSMATVAISDIDTEPTAHPVETSRNRAISLAAAVQTAPIRLTGVLCRRRMTLGELRGLTAGKLLHLPRVNLGETRLETETGQLVATGKFGEFEGYHAIRLRDPENEASVPAVMAGTMSVGHNQDEAPMQDIAFPDAFRPVDKYGVENHSVPREIPVKTP